MSQVVNCLFRIKNTCGFCLENGLDVVIQPKVRVIVWDMISLLVINISVLC